MPDNIASTIVITAAKPNKAPAIPTASFMADELFTPTTSSDHALATPSTRPQTPNANNAIGRSTTAVNSTSDNAAMAACHRGVVTDGRPAGCPFIPHPCSQAWSAGWRTLHQDQPYRQVLPMAFDGATGDCHARPGDTVRYAVVVMAYLGVTCRISRPIESNSYSSHFNVASGCLRQ